VTGLRRKWPIGAELLDGGVHFRVWAAAHEHVTLVLETPERREVRFRHELDGHHSVFVDGLRAGARYRFRLGDDARLHADPASRFQPEGPFGPSQVVDPDDTAWTDEGWRGVTSPHTQVIYEMHVGTFTPQGTWAAAADALPFLRDIGITTIEMMPVNEFPGRRGWGYDGVNLWAPYHRYGTPAELRELVDRAHALELAVLLDVVYNHFGPSGNSHFDFAPEIRQDVRGEWGDLLDFTRPGLRELVIANARYWIEEFHFDGLRIDATQAIADPSKVHILREITDAVRSAAGRRSTFIVGENEPQDTSLLGRDGCGLDALWNDDFHHTARVAMTGSRDGYFHDYRGTPQELVSAVEHGFLYQGQVYSWQRNARGTSTRGIPRSAFVSYLENHDQVANRALGERLASIVDPASLRAMTALLLLGPEIPMLFQGQETGARQPFRFFCDHDEELSKLVRHGRAEFLSQFAAAATPEARATFPDPSAPVTFHECVLDPAGRDLDRPIVRLHRDLLRLRREHPCFTDPRADTLRGGLVGESALCLRWWHEHGDRLLLLNLGRTFESNVLPQPLLAPPPGCGWQVTWSSEHPSYGGVGTPEPFTIERLAIPARAAVLLAPDPGRLLRVEPPPPLDTKDTP
jgi:maltooligosyltrehalose trehalohydrolase